MTTPDATYLILFATNLAFIVTHLYGWLLKWFYKPKAYRDHFRELFPAQRSVGVIYLLQLFELPYLLQIGDRDALLYVNAFSLLFFSIQMLIMCEGYFFPTPQRRHRDIWLFLPAAVVLLPLFLQAVNIVAMPHGSRSRCRQRVAEIRPPDRRPETDPQRHRLGLQLRAGLATHSDLWRRLDGRTKTLDDVLEVQANTIYTIPEIEF